MNSQEKNNFVFVYGTLMSGGGNFHRLGDGELVMDDARTEGNFRMVDLGAFPGVVKSVGKPDSPEAIARAHSLYLPIRGQVYRVSDNTLRNSLDPLEGNGRFYTREKVKIKGLSIVKGAPISGEAWMYILPPEFSNRETCVPREDRVYCWKQQQYVKKIYKDVGEKIKETVEG